MIFYLGIAAFVGFLIALKLPLAVALVILSLAFIIAVNLEGLENVIFFFAPTVFAWAGAILGWLYFYVNFQPALSWTIAKTLRWFFTP